MNTQQKALLLADVHEDGTELGDSTAAELRRLHFENLEQARLLGMSAEREVALIAKIEEHAEKLKYDIHSCGPTCERYICVATRNAVAHEREECAKECEIETAVNVVNAPKEYQDGRAMGAAVCAFRIRARGDK